MVSILILSVKVITVILLINFIFCCCCHYFIWLFQCLYLVSRIYVLYIFSCFFFRTLSDIYFFLVWHCVPKVSRTRSFLFITILFFMESFNFNTIILVYHKLVIFLLANNMVRVSACIAWLPASGTIFNNLYFLFNNPDSFWIRSFSLFHYVVHVTLKNTQNSEHLWWIFLFRSCSKNLFRSRILILMFCI